MNEYSIIVNDKSYELPKKTIKITEKLDEALRVDQMSQLSIRQKFEKLHKFVKEVLGEDNAKEVLGFSKLDEIDLSELSVIVLKINDAYDKPLADYRTEMANEKFSSIPLDKIASMTKAAQAVTNAQMLAK